MPAASGCSVLQDFAGGPIRFFGPGGVEVLRYLEQSPSAMRFLERVGKLEADGLAADRSGLLERLSTFLRSPEEQHLNRAGMQTNRQFFEASLWFRVAYHVLREYGDIADGRGQSAASAPSGWLTPAIDLWSGTLVRPAPRGRNRPDILPAAVRRFEELQLPPLEGDCASATRSNDLARLIRTGFSVESVRPYGGNLVAPLAAAVDWSRVPPGDLKRLAEGSDRNAAHYALTVARPRIGWRRRWAEWGYRLGPKVRRVFLYEPRRARDLVLQALRGRV